jgi:hypothetical protein
VLYPTELRAHNGGSVSVASLSMAFLASGVAESIRRMSSIAGPAVYRRCSAFTPGTSRYHIIMPNIRASFVTLRSQARCRLMLADERLAFAIKMPEAERDFMRRRRRLPRQRGVDVHRRRNEAVLYSVHADADT